ncbi:YycH family regulatory protein [Paenibacillus hexagrammi]|uniref:Two-component system activity regulator YycH n=1 Tax=Paenibacillus hexagrammi TaxID=2908839 RepID=A0ABY3SK39_9BACL|nr:two-component system activity regulator YycH [Paenibacillus sp. YPD9-1]UJF33342.1 two-component system activity regulator YycH [Paenibacillus sp. YPD9-1]
MIEGLKSVLLVVLIVLSLYQSFLLASYNPTKIEPLQQSDYVQTETPGLGKQAEIEDMLFPDQIIVHLGNEQHSVLFPNSYYYTRLLDNIKQRRFNGFRKTTLYLANINWEEVRTKQQGVEIRFRDGMPFSVLQTLLRIEGDIPAENDLITKIWIFSKGANEEVQAFFFTDSPNVGYEVVSADFTSKDIENFVAYGDLTNLYKTTNGDYYLPVKPVRMPSYTFDYTLLTADQLKASYFVDPGITRNLKERDGSEIYTDSKRGFQINRDQSWITYSDPVAPVESSKSDVREDLIAGIKFVNQHIGWDGKYVVARTPQLQPFDNQIFLFREYYEALPIITGKLEGFGTMKMQVQKGVVTGFERSMIVPDFKTLQRSDSELLSGADLEARLQYYQRRTSIVSIFPAYRPLISEKTLSLTPVWAIELRDGTYDFME